MIEVISKDTSMYDYAEDFFKIENIFEKTEGRKMTKDERLMLIAILASEEKGG